MHFKNSIDARAEVVRGEINTMKSETEPDQTMSIKEIISRHAQGISLDVKQYEPFYSEDEIPDLESMDLEEIAQYREHLSTERFRLEDELRDRIKEEQQKRDEPSPTPPAEPE